MLSNRVRAAIAGVVVVGVVVAQIVRQGDAVPEQPETRVVDASVPDSRLLDSVLEIVDAQAKGALNSGDALSGIGESQQVPGAEKFWATVEFVPSNEAAWLTELVSRAKAAPKQ